MVCSIRADDPFPIGQYSGKCQFHLVELSCTGFESTLVFQDMLFFWSWGLVLGGLEVIYRSICGMTYNV